MNELCYNPAILSWGTYPKKMSSISRDIVPFIQTLATKT